MVDVIYFDFAKAFDTVPHRRLLKKLEEYGVKNEVLLWVESFLKDRHQLVKVHGAKSEKKESIEWCTTRHRFWSTLFNVYQ